MNLTVSLPGLSIETSFLYDVKSQGELKAIDYINPLPSQVLNLNEGMVALYTTGNRVFIEDDIITKCVAIVVDSNMTVTKVVNKAPSNGKSPLFTESTDMEVPDGGFIILSYDTDYENGQVRRFFAEKFHAGDIVKLRLHNKKVSLNEVLSQIGYPEKAMLTLLDNEYITTENGTYSLQGSIMAANEQLEYNIKAKLYSGQGIFVTEYNTKTSISSNYQFLVEMQLQEGTNYIDIYLYEDGNLLTYANQKRVIYKKHETLQKEKQVIMWVEQFVNGKTLNTTDKMEKVITTAKNAGITAFAVDVKGCEGYAAYKKATLSHTPYMTEVKDPRKQFEMDTDFLEDFIHLSHKYDLKVYASFNFFVEGNISTGDYAVNVPELHPDWAEIIQAPEDKGELKSVLNTSRNAMLLYVNPANDEVQDFQLKRVEEVLMNYEVDGVIMDRARYDHQYADFSEETKEKFTNFLAVRGKTLDHWPADIYTIHTDGTMSLGKHYYEWITFRSMVIQKFSNRLKMLIDSYSKKYDRDIKLAAYVGSWYETYYQNGVNWADKDFVYNERLNFPNSELYTSEYGKTSYLNNIDFLMIGCYYETKEQILKYITLGNILTNEKVDLIGSISLPDLKTKEALREGFQTVYQNSNGGMLFDLCYTDWDKLKTAISKDEDPSNYSF